MPAPRILFLLALAAATPAAAQSVGGGQTLGYQWLQAVKTEDGRKLMDLSAKRSQLNSAVLDYQSDGEGAIHVATRKGNVEYLRFMLALGASPNLLSDKSGESPLGMAVLADSPDAVATLLQFKARIDQANRGGETPLITAVRYRRAQMVTLLLERGADPDKPDYTGKSARMYAAEDARDPQVTKALAAAPKRVQRAVAGPKLN